MSEYPTEDEMFELMHRDELDVIEDLAFESGGINTVYLTQTLATNITEINSPQLSQIPKDGNSLFTQPTVNRKLFSTPTLNGKIKKITSTPLDKQVMSTPFAPTVLSTDRNGLDPPVTTMDISQSVGIVNRKRRLEDLFGDIEDLDEENEHNVGKKTKSELEVDLQLIDRILLARRRTNEPRIHKSLDIRRLEEVQAFKMKNLSNTLPAWPYIILIRDLTERVYVRYHSKEFEERQLNDIKSYNKFDNLLGEGRSEIWDEAKKMVEARLMHLSSSQTEQEDVPLNENFISEESCLWVEKYRPKRYIDLLSDETTNRSLLCWLKMWDKMVFKRNFNPNSGTASGPTNTFNKKSGKFELNTKWRTKKPSLETEIDSYGRPNQKIALLCGPPGLGKTTLAHTIAQHAGYNVCEVNASNDRSPEAFKLALENGTQMTSILNVDNRPNCIILDEIDGAPSASIDFLIKFITDRVRKSKKGDGKITNVILRRPIICICNDLYVPALRQVRKIAFVVNFPQLEKSRLAERLEQIARKEKIETDLTALLALAEKTGNDIRSCISMLQFFSSLKKPLTLIDVLRHNIGQKDRQKGLFEIWSAIFQVQRPRKIIIHDNNNQDNGITEEIVSMSDMSIKTRTQNILEVIHMGGDYERLMMGVYENYLQQRMPDPNFTGVVEAINWFTFSDRVQNLIHHKQNYSIYPYLQYGFVAWHLIFAGLGWPKLHFPNQGFEFSQKSSFQNLIAKAFRKGICAHRIGSNEGTSLILDTIPLIRKVICPSLRSVSLHLLTPRERDDLKHAVQVMADFGLVFNQMKLTDGTYHYQMEPDIEILCQFEAAPTNALSYWSRQLLAREIEMENMRRSMPKVNNLDKASIVPSTTSLDRLKTKQQNLPNHLQTLRPISIQPMRDSKICKDFFGRIIPKPSKQDEQTRQDASSSTARSPIWYKFKEGFNNAVRKDITLSNLL